MMGNISKIQIVQINLQPAKTSTYLLCAQPSRLHTFIALIQEPWVLNNVIHELPNIPNTNCFYLEYNWKPRAAILASNIQIEPLFLNSDMVAISIRPDPTQNLYNIKPTIVVSIYLPIEDLNILSTQLQNLITYWKTNSICWRLWPQCT